MYLCYSLAHEVALLGELSYILVKRYVALLPSITVQGTEYVSIILQGKARIQLPLITFQPLVCGGIWATSSNSKEPSNILLSQRNGTVELFVRAKSNLQAQGQVAKWCGRAPFNLHWQIWGKTPSSRYPIQDSPHPQPHQAIPDWPGWEQGESSGEAAHLQQPPWLLPDHATNQGASENHGPSIPDSVVPPNKPLGESGIPASISKDYSRENLTFSFF